jgi:hypothetical protein
MEQGHILHGLCGNTCDGVCRSLINVAMLGSVQVAAGHCWALLATVGLWPELTAAASLLATAGVVWPLAATTAC